MKNHIFSIGLLAVLAISCSIHEMDFKDSYAFEEFYASIENTETPDTKVYATEELYLRWNADDRITIFNKYTYNQEYRFTGETGDNSGSFKRVDNGDFVTGNSLDNIYAIYPYLESTRISDTGVITVTLPSEQTYVENTMGLGANTMVSATADNQLLFKNVGGYLMLKLYGDDVTVSSISMKGNNGERIAGKATVSMPINGVPTVAMSESAGQEITLVCETPVKIGSTAETATTFWIVVPPTVFSKGFTLTVKDNKNGVFEKATTKSFEIGRNKLARMSALEVSPVPPEPSDEAIVFADPKLKERLVAKFDTNGDGELSYKEAAAVTSIEGAVNIKTVTSFDEFQFFTGVHTINSNLFKDWESLTSIIIPSNVTRIESGAFMNCAGLLSIKFNNIVSFLGYEVFSGCYSLTKVDLPNSITEIQSPPKGLYTRGCFEHCTNLTSIHLPENILSIPEYIFYDCPALTDVILPSKVRHIGYGAFYGCSSLRSIDIPDSVITFGSRDEFNSSTSFFNGVFTNCSALEDIKLSESLNSISGYTFMGCKSLRTITIPNSVSNIGKNAFSGCYNLSSIIIPNSVKEIDSGAFSNCISITSIAIPDGVSSLRGTFYGCTALVSISIPDSVTDLGGSTFYGCSSLLSVTIPESVSVIGYQLFYKCSSLEKIIIPESITTIGENAFYECNNLPTITIPESVKEIKEGAFQGCANLQSVRVNRTIPPSCEGGIFTNTNNCPIYVPAGSFEAYKSAQYWSDYADRIRPIPEAVDLGLSVKWASFNLGASKPEEYGDYYAWGETEPYYISLDPLTWKDGKEDGYSWSTYKWCAGDKNSITKYCANSSYGYNGFTDTKTVLDPEDDVAHVNLSDNWRMPTDAEWQELITSCTWTWTTQNGVNGRLVTANNGNSIFLPAAGVIDSELYGVGGTGCYWSSSLNSGSPNLARYVYVRSIDFGRGVGTRYSGSTVRPVYAE